VIDTFHGRIAQPRVGTALRRHRQVEGARSMLDGNAYRYVAAPDFYVLLERGVELYVADGNPRLAERDVAITVTRREREALAVHVITVRNPVMHVYFARLFGRAETEGHIGLQEIVVICARRIRASAKKKEQCAAQQQHCGQHHAHHAQGLPEIKIAVKMKTVKHEGDVAFRD